MDADERKHDVGAETLIAIFGAEEVLRVSLLPPKERTVEVQKWLKRLSALKGALKEGT
jgi:hypothetical protein